MKAFDSSLDISTYIGQNVANMSALHVSNAPTTYHANNIPILQTNAVENDVPMSSSMNSNGLIGVHQNVANMSALHVSNAPTTYHANNIPVLQTNVRIDDVSMLSSMTSNGLIGVHQNVANMSTLNVSSAPTASNANNIPILQTNAVENDVPMSSSMNSNGLIGSLSLPNTPSFNDYFHSNQPVSENTIAGKKRKIGYLTLSTSPSPDFVSSFLTIDTPESLKTSQRTISTQQMNEDNLHSNRPLSPYYADSTPVRQPAEPETPNTDATPRKNLFGNASPIFTSNNRTTEFVRMHDGRRNSTPLPKCVNAPPQLNPKQRKDRM